MLSSEHRDLIIFGYVRQTEVSIFGDSSQDDTYYSTPARATSIIQSFCGGFELQCTISMENRNDKKYRVYGMFDKVHDVVIETSCRSYSDMEDSGIFRSTIIGDFRFSQHNDYGRDYSSGSTRITENGEILYEHKWNNGGEESSKRKLSSAEIIKNVAKIYNVTSEEFMKQIKQNEIELYGIKEEE